MHSLGRHVPATQIKCIFVYPEALIAVSQPLLNETELRRGVDSDGCTSAIWLMDHVHSYKNCTSSYKSLHWRECSFQWRSGVETTPGRRFWVNPDYFFFPRMGFLGMHALVWWRHATHSCSFTMTLAMGRRLLSDYCILACAWNTWETLLAWEILQKERPKCTSQEFRLKKRECDV